jgi:hypothetical protein
MRGHHHGSGSGGDQHQAPHACAGLDRKLLGQPATPGQPEDVELAMAEPGHQGGDPGRQSCDRVGERWQLAPTDAGYVEPHNSAVRIQRVDQGLQRLEAGADAVAQQ